MTVAAETAGGTAPASPVATLFPGYFALVMATGIIAIGALQQDIRWLADGLYVVAATAYVVLAVLVIARLVLYRLLLVADLTSHAKGFAFLTIVAGTNVLGSASALIHGWWGLARGMWWAGIVLWVVLLYTALIGVILKRDKPDVGHRHQRHLVPAHGLDPVHRSPGSAAARTRTRTTSSRSSVSRCSCWASCCTSSS